MFCRVQLTAVWALLLQSANGLTASPRALASSSSSLMMMMMMAMMTPMTRIVMVMTMMVTYVRAPCRVTEHHVLAQQPAPRLQKGKVDFFWSSFLHISTPWRILSCLFEKSRFPRMQIIISYVVSSYKRASMISLVKIACRSCGPPQSISREV